MQSSVVSFVNETEVPKNHITQYTVGHQTNLFQDRKNVARLLLDNSAKIFASSSHKTGTYDELCESYEQGRRIFPSLKKMISKNK